MDNKIFWQDKMEKVNLSTLIQPCKVVSTCAKPNSVDGHLVINVLFRLIINLIIRDYEEDIEEAEWFRLTLFCVPLT